MLGIALPTYNGREGLGGGGHAMARRELSMDKLETNLVQSGQKLPYQISKNSPSKTPYYQ